MSGNDESREYYEKIEEMLTVPRFHKNQFLLNVQNFIDERGYITSKQKEAVDRMDNE